MLSELIAAYLKEKAQDKLLKFDKETAKKRKGIDDNYQMIEFNAQRNQERFSLEESLQPTNWITDAAKRAKQINLITHALKFTHTDAKGSSIFDMIAVENESYLTTAFLSIKKPDIVGNAAALDVAKFLFLNDEGATLISCLQNGDVSALKPFAQSESQLTKWVDGFLEVLVPNELSSHTLAKQVYFKVNDQPGYHLLSPLFPSSLMQAVYERVNESRYSESAKEARKAKKDKKYSEQPVIFYPNLLVQTFGGTKPQNVSQFNSSRHGRAYLFCSAPPTWEIKLRAPTKDFIFSVYASTVKKQVKDLKKFLLNMRHHKKNMHRREERDIYVDELIDQLLLQATQIQHFPPGWSVQSKLPEAQQLWLDPKRSKSDEKFKSDYEKKLWKKEISQQFARWLNKKLSAKNLNLGTPEYQHWRDMLAKKLVEMEEYLEV